ncbi:MAG TPA: response regulator transcription factor [Actinomycetota bacterium]|nr:response regulator transcription factor [Actinomycetota bacterium]
MTRRTVLVLHPEPLVAEAIASALERYPWLAPIAVGRRAVDGIDIPVDAVVIDGRLEGARPAATSHHERGRHVIVLGEPGPGAPASVAPAGSMDELAHALALGVEVGSSRARSLSTREREVLHLIAKGLAAKQMATLLGISPKTVEQHKTRIYGKLGVANQAEAVAVASRSGEGVAWVSSTT